MFLPYISIGCLSIRQRYNLKAIHNPNTAIDTAIIVVYQYVKDTIWKQFTTNLSLCQQIKSCLSIRQRYNLKAIHNHYLFQLCKYRVVYQYVKDTIWKQFTTHFLYVVLLLLLFINTSKIQFESNSQLSRCNNKIRRRCLSIRQRYNLKAIHN